MKLEKISKISVLASRCLFQWVGYGILSLLAAACSLKNQSSSGVTHAIEIALPQSSSHVSSVSNGIVKQMSEVPVALADFTCYMVNITGPTIPMDPRLSCAVPTDGLGVFVGFIPAGAQSATLNVPSGQVDIQLIGIDNPGGGCPNLNSSLTAASLHGLGELYLLASDSLNITGATTVDMTASFNAGSPQTALQSCTGPALAFTTQPGTTGSSGGVLGTQPVIQVQNSAGSLLGTATNAVTLAAYTDSDCNTPASGTVSATSNPVSAVGGVATFSGVTYTGAPGTIYLGATGSGVNSACSNAIAVSSGATKLAVFTEPSTSESSGAALGVQPVIQIQNSSSTIVSTASASVTLNAYTDAGCTSPASGTLTGGNPMSTTSGAASFTGITYTGVDGTIYLGASASGLSPACSTAISVGAGTATKVVFATQPSSSASMGTPFGTQPVVSIEDVSGNIVTSASGSVSLSAYTNSSCSTSASGTLSGGTVSASAGQATFTSANYSGSVSTIYLKASSGSLTVACSGPIAVSAGPVSASMSTVSASPSTVTANGLTTSSITVTLKDAYGNPVSGKTVTLASSRGATDTISAASGSSTTSGLVTFTVKSTTSGSSTYTATDSSDSITVSSTATVNYVAGAAAKLVFTAQPQLNILPQATFSATVAVQDINGNLVTSPSVSVDLIVAANPAGASVFGTTMGVSTSAGIANFTGLTIDIPAVGLTLVASSTGLTSATGNTLNVVGVTQQIAASNNGNSNCVVSSAHNVYCWGANNDGQLGNNTTTQEETPVKVTGVGGSGFLSGVVGVAVGNSHACALNSSGNVYCWGSDQYGQLGDNSTAGTGTCGSYGCAVAPTEVVGVGGSGYLSGIVSISSGSAHTCAVNSSGNVYCWGNNNYAQIGNNTVTQENAPVEVTGVGGSGNLSGIVSVFAGQSHTCAVSSGGNVYCWGWNATAQLGTGSASGPQTCSSNACSEAPVEVVGTGGTGNLSNIVSLAGGANSTCALDAYGDVYCWGANTDGEIGNNSTSGNQLDPVEVLGVGGSGNISNIANIAATNNSVCAVSSAGSVYCWGDNAQGQLGQENTSNSSAPLQVLGVGGTGLLTGMVNVAGGAFHSCGLTSVGNIYCWGYNTSGQLGNNTLVENNAPVLVQGISGVGFFSTFTTSQTLLAAGNSGMHTCAVSLSGNVYCWGWNEDGELGNSSPYSGVTPVEVWGTSGTGSLSNVVSMSAGDHGSCALNTSGNLYCWGFDNYGQVGNNTSVGEVADPTEVEGPGGSGVLSSVVSVASGGFQNCAVDSSGDAWCWGAGFAGDLGDAGTANSATPVAVLGEGGSGTLSGLVSITAGNEHSCALSSSGNIYCWGSNSDGQLGNNTTTDESVPVEVTGIGGTGNIAGVVSIAAGYQHTCALNYGGNVYCWGLGNSGQLGNNSTSNESSPVEVLGVGASGVLSNIVGIAAGQSHTCALNTSGNVYCWGQGSDGQLGRNSTSGTATPVEVVGVGGTGYLQNIVAITAGSEHTCALDMYDNVYCWGDNSVGELGNNTTTQENSPVEVLGVGGTGFLSGI